MTHALARIVPRPPLVTSIRFVPALFRRRRPPNVRRAGSPAGEFGGIIAAIHVQPRH